MSDFQPFEVGKNSDFASEQKFESKDFRISKNLSAAIVENPGLKEVLEEEVQKRLEKRLTEDNSSKLETLFEESRAAGREAGLEQAKAELNFFKKVLEAFSQELQAQKKALFADVEEDWTRALKAILEKSFVYGAAELVPQATRWLAEQAEQSPEPLLVFVAPADFDAFQKEWELLGGDGVRFEKDEDLAKGQFRLKSNHGEQSFAPSHALEKLDAIIANHFKKDQ
ncbi:MAG: hypothetical protein R3B54_05610 [Bdellovibrionota bacterium]